MELRFKTTCSLTAAAELSQAECQEILKDILHSAMEKDRGVHEGLAFSFDMHGKEWSVVVDIQERLINIMSREELEKSIKDAVQNN